MSSQPPDAPLAQVKFLTVAEVATLMRVSKMTGLPVGALR